MLSQQMRSGNCELEDGDGSLSLIPSNSVGNYNNQLDHRERLVPVTQLLFSDPTSLSATVLSPTSVVATAFVFGCFVFMRQCVMLFCPWSLCEEINIREKN